MNEPAAQSEVFAGQTEELQEEVQSLRMLLCISLVLVMVLGACGDFFLIKQISEVRTGLGNLELKFGWKAYEVTPNEAAENARVPKFVDFWNKMTEYTKTHPDFSPVMEGAGRFIGQTLLNPAFAPKKQ